MWLRRECTITLARSDIGSVLPYPRKTEGSAKRYNLHIPPNLTFYGVVLVPAGAKTFQFILTGVPCVRLPLLFLGRQHCKLNGGGGGSGSVRPFEEIYSFRGGGGGGGS